MAAPKSLEPVETPVRVRGMMEDSTVWRREETRVDGEDDGAFEVEDMVELMAHADLI